MSEYLVDIQHERLSFFTPAGEVKALNDVSIHLNDGEVLGIVGESGSGKSVTAYSLMGLTAYPGKLVGGTIDFNGHRINDLSEKEFRKIRGNEVSIIFQDPMTSLNPIMTIGTQIEEVLLLHNHISKAEAIKRTEDILLSPIVPGTFGASIAKENRGILDNQGWELTINYNLSRGNWKHNFSLNLADSQNEVVRYGTPAIRTADSAGTIIMEGLPINALYGWKTNGFFQNYDEIQNAALPTGIDRSQLRPGDVRYVDLNSDGKIDENDRTYLGYAFPRYTYGFTYNVKWKGIDFSIMLQGVLKRENPVRGELVQPFHADYSMTMFDHQLDYWSPQNRDARWPRLGVSGSVSDTNNWGHTGSDMMLLEGAYMRIKNIQLGYTLPKKWTKKFGCEALRIYFDTQNPLTWTKNGFVDPETTSFGNNMSGGADNSVRNYPTLRYFGGGIDLTF